LGEVRARKRIPSVGPGGFHSRGRELRGSEHRKRNRKREARELLYPMLAQNSRREERWKKNCDLV